MIGSETPRYYTASNGKQYPSVTTVLSVLDKPALIPWAINMCIDGAVNSLTPRQKYTPTDVRKAMVAAKWSYKAKSEEACNIGTSVHDITEYFFKHGALPEIDWEANDEIRRSVMSFMDWGLAHEMEVVSLEVPIEGPGYAGRLDAVIRLDGVVTLVDYKTSKGFYDTYPMQLAAYTYAYNLDPANEHKIERMGVLRLPKDSAPYEYRDYTDTFSSSLAEFMSLAMFWAVHRLNDFEIVKEQVEVMKKIASSVGPQS